MLGLVIAVAMVMAARAAGATFVVNVHGDHAPGKCTNSDCTLREAVLAANKADGADRIELPGTEAYRLTREPDTPDPRFGDLDVRDPLRLVHPGPGRAPVESTVIDRVLESEASLTVRKLVVRGGRVEGSGGGIASRHDLKLVRAKVAQNSAITAGGIFAGLPVEDPVSLTVRRSRVVGNDSTGGRGGGIEFEGAELTVRKSTVARNFAGCDGLCLVFDPWDGGGIHADASTGVISRSTISDNEAWDHGGGLSNASDDIEVVNSTIAGNEARGSGGGLYGAPTSSAELNAVTIARNRADADDMDPEGGGGIFGDGGSDVVFIRNSLLARNRTTGGVFQDCDAPAPVGVASNGGNVITTDDDCPFFDHAEDIEAASPLIAQLGDYGGPTQTVKLKAGGPAIGEADGPNPPARDQRGALRANPDSGAYER